MDFVSIDASPKVSRQTYRKAPAPPPPPSTSQHSAVKITSNHQRSHSATNEMSGPVLHYERPSVPPPAPPKKLEKPNAGNKSDFLTSQKTNQVGHMVGGLKQVSPIVFAVVGEGSNSDLSVDLESGLLTQSADTSGASEVADLSWSSEPDQSNSAPQPKEDIRKMTAQLKAQWWQNSPTPSSTDSKMSIVEISGKFNPRSTSPSEPRCNSGQDEKPENKTLENDNCQEKTENADRKSDETDKAPESTEIKSDIMDVDRDRAGDLFNPSDEKVGCLDTKRRSTDSISIASEKQNDESDKLVAESAISKTVATTAVRTPPIPSPRSSLAVDRDSELVVTTECGDSSELAPETTTVNTAGTRSTPPTVCIRGTESSAQAETSPASPTTPRAPLTRGKPVKTPPARPPPFTSPAELHSEPRPPLLPRRTSMDSKPAAPPDSPTELPTSPQFDLPPKTRSLDRVRPEKPPPPLPKSFRSQMSQPAVEIEPDVDCRDKVAAEHDVATHDEHTHL